MAHLVESMAFNIQGGLPWHIKETKDRSKGHDGLMNSEQILELAGLNFSTIKVPAYARLPEELSGLIGIDYRVIPEKYAVIRDTDGLVLGDVGKVYEPWQTTQMAQDMVDLMQEGIIFETGGLLTNGVVWLLAKVPLTIRITEDNSEVIEPFFLLMNDFSGRMRYNGRSIFTRVVCNNTLQMALGETSKFYFNIKHTKAMESRISEAKKAIGFINLSIENVQKVSKLLIEKSFSESEMEILVKSLLPAEEDKVSTRTDNQRTELLEVYRSGGANGNLNNFNGTAWKAYNAVAEFLDHSIEARGKNDNIRTTNKFMSTLEGTIGKKKEFALEYLMKV